VDSLHVEIIVLSSTRLMTWIDYMSRKIFSEFSSIGFRCIASDRGERTKLRSTRRRRGGRSIDAAGQSE
jgi:hypothetical protein